jgi:hypothetical protein
LKNRKIVAALRRVILVILNGLCACTLLTVQYGSLLFFFLHGLTNAFIAEPIRRPKHSKARGWSLFGVGGT